jgi:predicted alpha/beta hydrolase family esterase
MGSQLVNAGAVGHLNPASGFGEWPMAATLLETWASRAPSRSPEDGR